jgi:hypothetical protein
VIVQDAVVDQGLRGLDGGERRGRRRGLSQVAAPARCGGRDSQGRFGCGVEHDPADLKWVAFFDGVSRPLCGACRADSDLADKIADEAEAIEASGEGEAGW